MNLRSCNGRVPIWGPDETRPIVLVEFPEREVFMGLYASHAGGRTPMECRERYWEILNALKDGATLEEAGRPYGLSRERIRQIEAKFKRLLSRWHFPPRTV